MDRSVALISSFGSVAIAKLRTNPTAYGQIQLLITQRVKDKEINGRSKWKQKSIKEYSEMQKSFK